jgi:drug/metabolite transporter (DMT)-like permease
MTAISTNKTYIGILLALTAVIVWSGNYVVARGIIQQVPPIAVAFYRWLLASICIVPFAYKAFKKDLPILLQHKTYLFFAAFTGVTLFNTFIYIAGHYTNAINLALIGTTGAPIIATILASIFLKEIISSYRLAGMAICFAGILVLLSQGSIERLSKFHFEKGDVLMLISATAFAVYNILVRKKPMNISALSFLMVTFLVGTIIIFPFFLIEKSNTTPIQWNMNLVYTFAYLALGNSVLSFLCWNAAIKHLGAAKTALFTNLIPIFSTIEAVLFLNEQLTKVHLISGGLIIAGLIVANLVFSKSTQTTTN